MHVFILAFKQSDNRMTNIRSMISLLEKMFGKKFWDNAIWKLLIGIMEKTPFRIRNDSNPPLTEKFWKDEFNNITHEREFSSSEGS